MAKPKLREIEERVMARGRMNDDDLKELLHVLNDDWQVSRQEADALLRLRNQIRDRPEGFEDLFYNAIRNSIVKDGRISAADTRWLSEMFNSRQAEEDCRFLHRLRMEVVEESPEFEALIRECNLQPQDASAK